MNARDRMATLHLRLGWTYAAFLHPREPNRAASVQAELLVRAYRFGMRAQRLGLHGAPQSIADAPDLLQAWFSGHDDAQIGAHAPACDCDAVRCIHRRPKRWMTPGADDGTWHHGAARDD